MLPVTVRTHIAAPREQVFDTVADLAARVAYTDHYMQELHLTRPRSTGVGAAARFKMRGLWTEVAIVEVDRPRRLREEGGIGRLGASRFYAEHEITDQGGGVTRVELTCWTDPVGPLGRVRERGLRRWLKRKSKTGLERLRKIFEEHRDGPLARTGIAGYEAHKAPRFGSSDYPVTGA